MNLKNTLKFQFIGFRKFYFLYLIIYVLFIIGTFLIFPKTINFKNFLVFYFLICIIFSFICGKYIYFDLGKIYINIKNNRHNFCINVIIGNIFNALTLSGLLAMVFLFTKLRFSIDFNVINLLTCTLLTITFYTLGNSYGLFLNKFRYCLVIFILLLFILFIIFENKINQLGLNTLYNLLTNDNITNSINLKSIIISSTIITIILNIVNCTKYIKANAIKLYNN